MFSRMVSRFVIPALGLFVLAPLAYASPQSRIVAINGSSRVPLEHTIPSRARLANDLGSAPGEYQAQHIVSSFQYDCGAASRSHAVAE